MDSAVCELCGQTITRRSSPTIHGVVHALDRHNAPCGLPCLGGGLDVASYRSGNAHGLIGYPRDELTRGMEPRPCPACTGKDPVPAVNAYGDRHNDG